MLEKNLSKNSKTYISILYALTEVEKTILVERFGAKKSMKEVGEILSLSDVRVKEIEDNAVEKIEKMLDYALI